MMNHNILWNLEKKLEKNKIYLYYNFFMLNAIIFFCFYFFYIFKSFKIILENLIKWGLGIGDWGLGIGDWAQSPIPNPQSPIPIPIYK